jgi:hypothetical protein
MMSDHVYFGGLMYASGMATGAVFWHFFAQWRKP